MCPDGGKTEPEASYVGEFGGVTFFRETELQPIRPDDERGASALVRNLVNATSARQREATVRTQLAHIGFEWMGYYTVLRQPEGGTMRAFLSTYSPLEWSRRYFEESYYELDPRNDKQRRSTLPLVWDLQSLHEIVARRPFCSRSRRFLEQMEESGLRSGIFQRLVFRGSRPDEETVVSLVSTAPSRRWIDDGVLGSSLTLALSMHDYLSTYVELPKAPSANLMPADPLPGIRLPTTQRAVLWHVAGGLTDREIAEKLNLSSHAVDYHLRQLRQRFAVRNRVQLVAATAHLRAAA
jgi:DNA-binding CsgD family transcriptional regulator